MKTILTFLLLKLSRNKSRLDVFWMGAFCTKLRCHLQIGLLLYTFGGGGGMSLRKILKRRSESGDPWRMPVIGVNGSKKACLCRTCRERLERKLRMRRLHWYKRFMRLSSMSKKTDVL